MKNEFHTCPRCPSDLPFDGFCTECGYMEEPGAGALVECPMCASYTGWDSECGICHTCGYDAVTDAEDPTIEDKEYDFDDSKVPEVFWPRQTEWTYAAATYEPPYAPYKLLVERLEKWPLIKVHDTSHWFNKWYCEKFLNGPLKRNVTEYPKALGPLIFIPKSMENTKQGYETLCHEGVHAKDFWKFGVIPFFLMQFILPWGPSGKALLEYRGYVASMQAKFDTTGKIDADLPSYYAQSFATRVYTYCWPWPKLMTKWFERARRRILKGVRYS